VFSDSIAIGRLSSDEGGEVNLVDIQTGELTTRKYRLISRRAKPVRKKVLTTSHRQGGGYSKRNKENITSTCTTKGDSGKDGLRRGDEGQGSEDSGDDDFVRGQVMK